MFFRVLVLFCLLPFISHAQEDARKLKFDGTRPIRIDYMAPSWNKDPNKAESSAILIRDGLSGRMVKVEMNESEPNSSLFFGVYQLSFQAGEKTDVTPEVYIAPMSMLKTDAQLSRIETLIKEGTLLRKPYFLRVEKKMQTLSVYDSREQALDAYQSFLKTGFGRPLIDPAVFDAQRVANRENAEKARALQAMQAEAARMKLQAQEKAKQEELRKKHALLTEEEKKQRQADSQRLASEAGMLYQKKDYKGAEEKFNQAIELDPDNNSYYFQYGTVLFYNEKYDKSVVILGLANGKDVDANQRDLFMAHSYMKLKELDKARALMTKLKNQKTDKGLAGQGAFYVAFIDYQREKYDDAKTNFEYVLDNSTDPKLDEQAEAYIEQIANIKKFEEMRKKKFILSANLGLMYDSNILSASEASKPTNSGGFRWTYGASAEYRPIFSEQHEFSALVSYADIYSMDSDFKASATFQQTDPLVLDFSLPYKWKGQAFGKPAQLGLTPTYETMTMNITGSERDLITKSTILKADGTFVMNDDWFSNYALEVRHDQSLIGEVTTISPEDDQTANKISLSTSQTIFQDKKKTRAVIWDAAVAMNKADGVNQTYNRLDAGASYLRPAFWDSIFVTRLGLGTASYPDHLTGRSDMAYSLGLTLQKELSEDLSATLMGMYSKNDSSAEDFAYNKYIIMTGFNWKRAF